MRKLLFALSFALAIATSSKAQLEIQVSPIDFYYGNIYLAAEYPLTKNISVELGIKNIFNTEINTKFNTDLAIRAISSEYLSIKYYHKNEKQKTASIFGAYTRMAHFADITEDGNGNNLRIALGVVIGSKLYLGKHFTFEITVYTGRILLKEDSDTAEDIISLIGFPVKTIDISSKFNIGYRF